MINSTPLESDAMPTSDPLRSIVPMFGGATSYVETLDTIIDYIIEHQPTTDEFVGWHRGTFERVSSRESILRRVEYLEDVGFILDDGATWMLGPEGERYIAERSTERLIEIMCRRNLGLRSLLYSLSVGPMTIEEVGAQQLRTHPELGWNPANYDMAYQRVNWLRSLGLVNKEGDTYSLSSAGWELTEDAVVVWTDTTMDQLDPEHATTFTTTVEGRSLDPEFRETALAIYERICPVSGVDHPELLDVAHILSWADYPAYRGDIQNVLPMSKLHHAAFDRELFTLDEEYRIRVNPRFETQSPILQETLHDREDEQISIKDGTLSTEYLRKYNSHLGWV